MTKERLKERHARYIENLQQLENQIAQGETQIKAMYEQRIFLQGQIVELQELIKECPDIPLPVPVMGISAIEPTGDSVSKIEEKP